MSTYYETAIAPAVEDLIGKKQAKQFTIVRHYSTFEIRQSDAEKMEQSYPDFYVCYKNYNGYKMIEAFDPFLSVIRTIYENYEQNKTPGEFIEQFPIYPLQRSVFEAILTQPVYRRLEEILMDEFVYEKQQMIDSIAAVLRALSEAHPMLFVLNNLNMASQSTILLLLKLFEENGGNIYVYGAFNELYVQLPHMVNIWEKWVETLEDYNCIVDGGADGEVRTEEGSYFHFTSRDIDEYLQKLSNMYFLFDFEQAQYYLAIIYRKIEVEKLSINEDRVFEFFALYAIISLYSDVPNALLLCDKLQVLQKKSGSLDKKFMYQYVLGQTQMYNGNLKAAKECANTCIELSEQGMDGLSRFKAELLKIMVRMSGWHNIFFCKTNTEISDGFIEKAKEYGFENHLAYTYIFAYDNDINLFRQEGEIGENLLYFKKGIALAKKLGNENLMLTAYRKNIMLSSSHGMFQVTNYYYYKAMEIIGDSDPLKLADVYNGLGYSSCAAEQYEEASRYYNKAIMIYYQLNMMNYVGETLYNMSINCILAGENEAAYNYLLTCMKIINILHLNDLRVCNISKIFGLLALSSHRLGMGYNTRIYLDNSRQFLGHILRRSTQEELQSLDLSYTACDDDIFLYYYVSALVEMDKNNLGQALIFMETAKVYMDRSVGNQFFSVVQYEISKAELFRRLNMEQAAKAELEKGISYAKRCNVVEKQRMLEAACSGTVYEQQHKSVAELSDITLAEIQTATKQAGIAKNYEALQKKMEFISVWQKIIDISGKSFSYLVENALNTVMSNFSIDAMIYIRYQEGKPQIIYDTKQVILGEADIQEITEYFSAHRSGFVTSKLRKNHVEYNRIISIFGTMQVCSMVGLPYYINEELNSVFIMYILMKDNWNAPVTKFMLDESDMEFFNLVLLQLQNAIEKLENEEQIRNINSRLEKSAITDYLTGLYNRDGFYQKIKDWVGNKITCDITFLYIDLDNFKYYNDTFGHAAGDRILQEVAEILCTAAGDRGFVTRYGGDEFLVSLSYVDKEGAMALGRGILETIRKNRGFVEIISEMSSKEIVIPQEKELSCSIGIAAVTDITEEEEITSAIQKADAVLYTIKHSTKGDVKYSD